MKRQKFYSREDALLAASKIHARSSVAEIAHVLRYLGNGALHEHLFDVGQLAPVVEWMRKGARFSRIAEIVWTRTIHLGRYHVKSWNFFSKAVEELFGEVHSYREAIIASQKIKPRTDSKAIAHILRYVGDGALDERLFRPRELRPVRDWMKEGIAFTVIVDVVWTRVRVENAPIGSIRSWSHFAEALKHSPRPSLIHFRQ